jgi:hypothetical protein
MTDTHLISNPKFQITSLCLSVPDIYMARDQDDDHNNHHHSNKDMVDAICILHANHNNPSNGAL